MSVCTVGNLKQFPTLIFSLRFRVHGFLRLFLFDCYCGWRWNMDYLIRPLSFISCDRDTISRPHIGLKGGSSTRKILIPPQLPHWRCHGILLLVYCLWLIFYCGFYVLSWLPGRFRSNRRCLQYYSTTLPDSRVQFSQPVSSALSRQCASSSQ